MNKIVSTDNNTHRGMDEKTDSRPTNGQGVIPTTPLNFAGVKIYNSIQQFMKIQY